MGERTWWAGVGMLVAATACGGKSTTDAISTTGGDSSAMGGARPGTNSAGGGTDATAAGGEGANAGLGNGGTPPAGTGGTGTGGVGTGGVGTGVECAESGEVVITDAANYSFSRAFTMDHVVVRDATNLLVDWSSATVDFFGVPIERGTIEMVMVTLWGKTVLQFATDLDDDNLPLADNKGALTYYPEGTETSATLLDFNIFGGPLPEDEIWTRLDTSQPDYQYPAETHTWLVSLHGGTSPVEDVRMMGLFTLDPAADETTVALTNESTRLDWSVSLADLPPVRVPAGLPQLTIDWSQMEQNAMGNPFDGTSITEVVVAHFPNATPAELEPGFLFLEDVADAWYTAEVLAGLVVDLDDSADASGESFPGIDASGVWLVALYCTVNCLNPAPWAITWLVPC